MTRDLIVLDALIAWRDSILQRDVLRKSKIDYLSNMAKLIERRILDLKQPLSEFLKTIPSHKFQIIDEIIEWSRSTKKVRCIILRSFYRFAQEEKIKPTDVIIPFPEYRDFQKAIISEFLSSNEDKAKSQFLTDDQLERFFNEIRSINERDFLICWTMWNLKCTIHQILNLKVGDYDLSTDVFKISENDLRFGELRMELKELISKQCEVKREKDLIFSTEKGKNIHPGQIVRNMKLASKRAKLPIIISPKILYAHAIIYGKQQFLSMPEKEKEKLSQLYDEQYRTVCEKLKNVFVK